MTHENYREPGEFGEGATVRRAEPTERRSTHWVHRGPEGLPCYCAATSDHAIGHEQADKPTEIDRLREALRKIAAYDDAAANAYLRATGSYRCFDEPGAVEMARGVLESGS